MGTVPRDPIFFPRMKFRAQKRIMRQHFDHVHWAMPSKYATGGYLEPGEAFLTISASCERLIQPLRALAETLAELTLVPRPVVQSAEFFDDFKRTTPHSESHESWKQ